MRWYSSDRNDHLADITFQTDKLETLIYGDYLWTLKVQDSGNTDSNTLISADYSSGLILNEVEELNAKGNITVEGVAQFASAKNSNAPVAGADLTNKSYTDSTFVKKYDRPGLRFAYESASSGVPASGKFRWYIDGGRRLRLSATTKDGIPWAVDTPIVDINFNEGHMFSIWTTVANSDNWRLKQTGTINRIDYHADDILCYVTYHAENGTFSTSAEYNITIAGLI